MAKQPGISTTRQGVLLRGVFKIILDSPTTLTGRQVMDRLSEVVPFTEYERGHYDSNPTEPRGVIATRFWTVNCVKAGWLVKTRSAWTVTDEGRSAYAAFTDPADFVRESERRYREWQKQRPSAGDGGEVLLSDAVLTEGSSQDELTVEIAEEQAWAVVSRYLSSMDPYEFQRLVAALLRAMGYHVAWISPPGPDRGIDIIAYTDPLGATGPRIKVQVKRRADKANVDAVRSFLAVLSLHDIGLYISTGGFTTEAEREARSQENRRLTLLDMERLFDLWVEHYGAVSEAERSLLPIRPVHFLAIHE